MQLQEKKLGTISYYQKGEHPQLLIHTGTHGDEWSVIEPTREYILAHTDQLPDFIYVPEVSPSAVAQKTRKNADGLDVNRNFFTTCTHPEVIDNLELINQHSFELFVSIHEDYEFSELYLYDTGLISQEKWQRFTNKLAAINLDTYDGVDDPADPALGHRFVNGYFSSGHMQPNPHSGNLSDYLLFNHKTKRGILPEIPTQCSTETKRRAIGLVFSELLPILL